MASCMAHALAHNRCFCSPAGLLEHLGSDGSGQGQLAAVVAHEVAHNMARHAVRLLYSLGTYMSAGIA